MDDERVYPIIIKISGKEVQIGSAKVEVGYGQAINRCIQEHDVTIKDIKIQFKKGDWITKVQSSW